MSEPLPEAYRRPPGAALEALEIVASRSGGEVQLQERNDLYRAKHTLQAGLQFTLDGIEAVHQINVRIAKLGYEDPAFYVFKQDYVEEHRDRFRRHMRRGSGITEETFGVEGYKRKRRY
jgi:hypothetical protein